LAFGSSSSWLVNFDASAVVPTAAENRPKTCYLNVYIHAHDVAAPLSEAQTQEILNALNGKLGPDDLGPFAAFSAEEKFTGQYWLDGKKVYRKVVDTGSLVSLTGIKLVPHGIAGLAQVVNMRGMFYRPSTSWLPLPWVGSVNGSLAVVGANIQLLTVPAAGLSDGLNSYVVLEYTCADR
jgi:hypothetical protein